MRTLYYIPLCPFSRKVRIALGEKNLECTLQFEAVWNKRPEFLDLNPAGKVPVLIDRENHLLLDSYAICEYLDESYPHTYSLYGKSLTQRAETRRLVAFFDDTFNHDVTYKIVFEKTLKRYFKLGHPDSNRIREGLHHLKEHFDYLSWLIEKRHWLAGESFSMADIAGAAHLSTLDFLNHINWEQHPAIKDWYARIKCRPSFRALLNDQVAGITPPAHYGDLDF